MRLLLLTVLLGIFLGTTEIGISASAATAYQCPSVIVDSKGICYLIDEANCLYECHYEEAS